MTSTTGDGIVPDVPEGIDGSHGSSTASDRLAAFCQHFRLPEQALPLSVLTYLQGQTDYRQLAMQCLRQAASPVASWIPGDGRHFRQAFCFPVAGTADGDRIFPRAGHAPFFLIELPCRRLLAFSAHSESSSVISLTSLLQSMAPYLERYAHSEGGWDEIGNALWMVQHRSFKFENFSLFSPAQALWHKYFPHGVTQLTSLSLFGLPATLPMSERIQAVNTLLATQTGHVCSALHRFRENLAPAVLTAIHAGNADPSIADYNLFFPHHELRRRNRLQAVDVAPLIGQNRQLRQAVDSARPLWPIYAAALQSPEEILRWLSDKTLDQIGEAWAGRIPKLLLTLAELPPEKRPRKEEEWKCFTAFAEPLSARWNTHARALLHDLGRIGWVAAARHVTALRALPADVANIRDVLDETCKVIGWETNLNTSVIRHPITQVLSRFGVMRQLRASLRWHELLRAGKEENSAANINMPVSPRRAAIVKEALGGAYRLSRSDTGCSPVPGEINLFVRLITGG